MMSVSITLPAPQPEPGMCFYYGDERICFERSHRQSKVDRVLIKVQPDCRVLVQAPQEASDNDVLQAVKKRARWIYQQLREFRAQQEHVTPRRYISGESHYYLGKQYQLKVIEAPDDKQQVKLLRGSLEVSVREQNPDKVQALLNDWYRHKAGDVFARRLDAMLDQALWVTGRPPFVFSPCKPSGAAAPLRSV
jgi:predicted metal-dependent hydrolase